MIKTFKDPRAAALFQGLAPKGLGQDIRKRAMMKLQMIDAATDISDLRQPPGNRLEALSGDRKGQHSIRVNRQWRICFVWKEGDAYDVEIVDYH